MASPDRTKMALDESRTLMLGAQILLGFQLEAPFQEGFVALPPLQKGMVIAALCAMTLVIGLLIAPGARHRIADRGETGADFRRFMRRVAAVTLLPFALALGLDLFIAGERVGGFDLGLAAALGGGIAALGFWYGPLLWRPRAGEPEMAERSGEKTTLGARIDYVLTEARVVLPGAQALLAFQLIIVLTDGFAALPAHAKTLHGLALGCIALATILLMAPAIWHRVVYRGEQRPGFYGAASRLLLVATLFLALGLSLDLHVVVERITGDRTLADVIALAAAAVLFGLWHLWPWLRRVERGNEAEDEIARRRAPR